MNQLQVIEKEGNLLVDSREVAEMVGKEHSNLMRDIRGYVAILENSNLNSQSFFIPSTYKTEGNNKTYDCFLLTRKGCDMVANKMTGEKGVLFTAAYVTRFEEMEIYLKQSHSPSYMIEDPIKRAEKWIEEQKQRQLLEVKTLMLEQQVAEAQPKLTYYDTILNSTKLLTVTQIAKDYGLSGQALNKILHEQGVQYKLSGQWLLYSQHANKGFTKSQTHIDSTGEARISTKWTQKGRLFIHGILTSLGYDPDTKIA